MPNLMEISPFQYNTVAASQTSQVLMRQAVAQANSGAATGTGTGARNDILESLLIVPATTAAGVVTIADGSGSAITVFAGGGTTALTTLTPFFVPIRARSLNGAWSVTTGANVSVIACGRFT